MIDIHTHVLPFVDDGSKSLQDSIKMVEEAVNVGVTDMIITPHFRSPYLCLKEKLIEEFEKFKKGINALGVPINLYLGQEICAVKKYADVLEENKLLTMNGTDFILAEFYFHKEMDVVDSVFELTRKGHKVIVAHPERYPYLTIDDIVEIKTCGGLIQINSGSILGDNGFKVKKLSKELLKRGLVDFVASDMHSGRKYVLAKAYEYVKKKFTEQYANKIFNENAKMIIEK